MATAKFKIPTDKQIWAEFDKHLVNLTEGYKQVKGVPECRGWMCCGRKGYVTCWVPKGNTLDLGVLGLLALPV